MEMGHKVQGTGRSTSLVAICLAIAERERERVVFGNAVFHVFKNNLHSFVKKKKAVEEFLLQVGYNHLSQHCDFVSKNFFGLIFFKAITI